MNIIWNINGTAFQPVSDSVCMLKVINPNTHVSPNSGSRRMAALTEFLKEESLPHVRVLWAPESLMYGFILRDTNIHVYVLCPYIHTHTCMHACTHTPNILCKMMCRQSMGGSNEAYIIINVSLFSDKNRSILIYINHCMDTILHKYTLIIILHPSWVGYNYYIHTLYT